MAICLGARFSSYSAFNSVLEEYSLENNVQFWKNGRTLQSSMKKAKRCCQANPDLVYYQLQVRCIHGGRNQRSKYATGERQVKTLRQNCPVQITLTLSNDAESLEVTACDLQHSHNVSEKLFKHLPQQRRLPPDVKEQVGKLMQLRVNKKWLQKEVQEETGKVVLLKDLSNISSWYKTSQLGPEDSLENAIQILQTNNADVNVLEKNNVLEGLFFQDKEMAHCFQSFPEILFIDATYKLSNLRFSCYIFLVEDGNGNSEVVGVGLLGKEDNATIEWLIESFKARNEDWTKIRAIMTDKDFIERRTLASQIPNAELMICLFHTLRIFKREITCEKMNISKDEQVKVKESLSKLCYSYTEEEYNKEYEEFQKIAPDSVLKYFNKNWHPIQKEWTRMVCSNGNFLNFTNNRLESLNAKLKSVIPRYSSLCSFIVEFFVILNSLRGERDHNAVASLQRVPVQSFHPGTPEAKYNSHLQPYPFKFVHKQIQLMTTGNIDLVSPGNYSYKCKEQQYPVNAVACSCKFFKSMRLPCQHVLLVRLHLGIDLFDESLCDTRWTRVYYGTVQRALSSHDQSQDTVGNVTINKKQKTACVPITSQKRYKTAMGLASELAGVVAESSGLFYERKLSLMKEILKLWKDGQEVIVSAAGGSNSEATNSSQLVESIPDGNSIRNEAAVSSDVPIESVDVHSELEMEEEQQSYANQKLFPSNSSCSGISLPKLLKKRGRSKGFGATVIGISKKAKMVREKKKPVEALNKEQQQREMLSWFVDDQHIDDAIYNNELIDEMHVEVIPDNVPPVAIQGKPPFHLIQPLFTPDAWQCVTNVLCFKMKSKQ